MTRHYPHIVVFIAAILIAGNASSAEQLYSKQPPTTPELAVVGPFAVGVTTLNVVDDNRLNTGNFITSAPRPLVLEVWYPATLSAAFDKNTPKATYSDVTRLQKPFELQGEAYRDAVPVSEGQFPLMFLSHGFTGYRTQMFYLAEHLASHGYMVVGIDHKDSTNAEVFDDATRASGFISTLYNRARDQQFLLDYFSNPNEALPILGLKARMDTNNAGIIGHSMGGFAALNTIGACYDFNAEQLKKIGAPAIIASLLPFRLNSCFAGREEIDPRWKAIQLFAPWGGEFNAHDAQAMATMTVPTFFVAGDQDNTSGFDNGVKKLFQQTGSEHNYMMVYENARHNIAGHPAPAAAFDTDFELGHYVEPSWKIETINRVNKHMTLAFLDCHVKQDDARCQYLPNRESVEQYQGADRQYSEPWPGFKHLWGSGITFYRQ